MSNFRELYKVQRLTNYRGISLVCGWENSTYSSGITDKYYYIDLVQSIRSIQI